MNGTPDVHEKEITAKLLGIKIARLERIRGCLDREGPMLPILHALQEEFGYIDEAPSR